MDNRQKLEMGAGKDYVIGVDFGTASVRAIVADAANGEEKSSAVFVYPRFQKGLYCSATKNQFRQHPLDYVEGLEQSITNALGQCSKEIQESIRAISVDTTGSTPVAVDESGTPLALHTEFMENPNAMFFLWKDHTAIAEAEEINAHTKKSDTNYLKYVGGIYSSEWFWAKLLYMLREDTKVAEACYSWVEHCDWIPFLLTGGQHADDIKRGVCAAGHKGLWSDEWGGLPPDEFFSSLDPSLQGFVNRLYTKTYTADMPAGNLSAEWARKLGLSTKVRVGVGAIDAHVGAIGGQIAPHFMSKVMGTSTCDMIVIPSNMLEDTLVKGICGQVQGSIIPGMVGLEAGQSAFGDVYEWFKDLLAWPIKQYLMNSGVPISENVAHTMREMELSILRDLSEAAGRLPLEMDLEWAVDWLNGRRTPDADQSLKGALFGLQLGTDAPRMFRALVEATCFGAKKIIERFREYNMEIKGIIGVGGVAKKSPYVMQMMSDILEMPIQVHKSEQTGAAGAAMLAATVAGIYPKVEDAMENMGQGFEQVYQPDFSRAKIYAERYFQYEALCKIVESTK
ncbi:MAG: ribulokinase [Bacteroidota bacterium]